MANLAYQVTGFAYQGAGQFAYQGSTDDSGPTNGATNYFETLSRSKRKKLEREAKRTLERAQPDSPEYLRALGQSIALEEYGRFRAEQARRAEAAAEAARQNANAAPQQLQVRGNRQKIGEDGEKPTASDLQQDDIAMMLILIAANLD